MNSHLPETRVLEEAARTAWPQSPLRTFEVHDEGWTNLVLEADEGLIFRFPRSPTAARSLGFEVRLLDLLGRHLSLSVPDPLRIATLEHPRGWPFMVYRKLSGEPLSDLPSMSLSDRERFAETFGRFFSELSRVPLRSLERLGAPPGDRVSWAGRYETILRRFRRVAARRIPAELADEVFRLFPRFFSVLRDSHYRPVLLHNDLWPSHILWDRGTRKPVGVLDWEDARFGDPAADLTELRGLGEGPTEELVASRRSSRDRSFAERLLFYRRVGSLQSLVYGFESGRDDIVRAQLRNLRSHLRLETLE
jgi:aminoglycoside 2''-phosphotransferase